MKKRYLRFGIRFDDLRGLAIGELGGMFSDIDEKCSTSVYLVDVRDDITSGYTFYLLESQSFKEVEEGSIVPVIFAKYKEEYASCGEYEGFWTIEDFSEFIEEYQSPIKNAFVDETKNLTMKKLQNSIDNYYINFPEPNTILWPKTASYSWVQDEYNKLQNQIVDNIKLSGEQKIFVSNPDIVEEAYEPSGIKICECGKEKHGFARHLQFCKMYE